MGGPMVMGKLSVPGRPTNLNYSRVRCGWRLFGHFFLLSIISLLSPSIWETARYRMKYCLSGPLSPKQPTNNQLRGRDSYFFIINSEFNAHLMQIYVILSTVKTHRIFFACD